MDWSGGQFWRRFIGTWGGMTHCLVQNKRVKQWTKSFLWSCWQQDDQTKSQFISFPEISQNEETPKEDTSPPSFGNMSISSEVSHLFFQLSGNSETWRVADFICLKMVPHNSNRKVLLYPEHWTNTSLDYVGNRQLFFPNAWSSLPLPESQKSWKFSFCRDQAALWNETHFNEQNKKHDFCYKTWKPSLDYPESGGLGWTGHCIHG